MTNEITETVFMIPKQFNLEESIKLKTGFYCLSLIAKNYLADLKLAGWTFYVVEAKRGRCHYASKTITVPMWAIREEATKPGYAIWYVAHELAHACSEEFSKIRDHHGPNFMHWLKVLCPREFQHYELGYKPRNAANAGIRKPY